MTEFTPGKFYRFRKASKKYFCCGLTEEEYPVFYAVSPNGGRSSAPFIVSECLKYKDYVEVKMPREFFLDSQMFAWSSLEGAVANSVEGRKPIRVREVLEE